MKTLSAYLCFFLILLCNRGLAQDTIRAAVIYSDSLKLNKLSSFQITQHSIKTVVTSVGERNIGQNVLSMPGISMGVEGASSFFVRGANAGNNILTLDGVKLFGYGHLLGQASIVPNSIIDKANFNVGGFDGEYNNFIASHLELSSRAGSMYKYIQSVSVSNFMLGGTIEGPIIKDKISYLISARISPLECEYKYIDKIFNTNFNVLDEFEVDVYDVFAKLTYDINKSHTINASVFTSSDYYGFGNNKYLYFNRVGWKNLLGNLQWKYAPNSKLMISSKLSYNKYSNQQKQEAYIENVFNELGVISKIENISSCVNLCYHIDKQWRVKSGLKISQSNYFPELIRIIGDENEATDGGMRKSTININLYAQVEYVYKKDGIVRFVVKENNYRIKDEIGGSFFHFSPEISLLNRIPIIGGLGIEATFDYLFQYDHTLEGLPLGWNTDMIVPSTSYVLPENSLQCYAAIYFRKKNHRISIGAYYKRMHNLTYFSKPDEFFGSYYAGWQDLVSIGRGASQGIEFLYLYEGSNFNSKIAYTFSKSLRQFEDLNDGNPFLSNYDRPHVLNMSLSYDVINYKNSKLTLNTSFTYQSGNLITMLAGYIPGYLPWEDKVIKVDYHTNQINNYRLKDYIRLDIGVNFDVYKKNTIHEISAGLYNALNRHNYFSLYYNLEELSWKQLYVFPLMPSVNYLLKF